MNRVAIALLIAALAGCTLEPHYVRPEPAVTPQWPQIDDRYRQSGDAAPSAAAQGVGSAASGGTAAVRAADIGWREFFTDVRLQKLIETALQHNPDAQVAIALNIRAAARAISDPASRLVPQNLVDSDRGY